MGFEPAGEDVKQQRRDACFQEHVEYWSTRNYNTTDQYKKGFERGWEDANAALRAGMTIDTSDFRKWSKQRAPECHVPEEDWEWVHGHGKGQEEAMKAGKQA